MNDCEEDEFVSGEIEQEARRATFALFPNKTRKQYELAFDSFSLLCKHMFGKFKKSVLLTYFEEKTKGWKSSTITLLR